MDIVSYCSTPKETKEGVGIEVVAGEVDRGTGEVEGELVALSAFLGRISSRYHSS